MADSQSPEEGVKRIMSEKGETRPQRGSVVSFPFDNDHPTSAFVASVAQQIAQSQKKSFGKQKHDTNHEGKRKNKDAKEPEQTKRVRRRTIIGMVHRIYVDRGSSSEVMYEHYFRNLGTETKAKLKEPRTPLVGFSSEVSYPIGTIDLNVTMGEPGKLRTITMKFAVVKSHYPYNVILGRTSLRSLGAVASTIHSMIKFPTTNGIATMTTKRKTLQECRRMEEVQGLALEERTVLLRVQASESKGTTIKGKEESRGQTNKTRESDKSIQPSPISSKNYTNRDEKGKEKDELLEKSGLIKILRKHVNAFAWTPADMTRIPRFVAEHKLKTYPHIEPRVQRKRSIAPDRRKVVKDEVAEWFKAGIVRKVRYPTWVANPVLVKKPDNNWRMCIDIKDLNKAYPKDLYPLPEIDWKIESLMGFKYKCFLDAYKGYYQIQMAKKDEEKTIFHTD
ncbi:reverse transcriptase domain-containing protein [Tanacetum coccineum]